jgi:hypothetical protein
LNAFNSWRTFAIVTTGPIKLPQERVEPAPPPAPRLPLVFVGLLVAAVSWIVTLYGVLLLPLLPLGLTGLAASVAALTYGFGDRVSIGVRCWWAVVAVVVTAPVTVVLANADW